MDFVIESQLNGQRLSELYIKEVNQADREERWVLVLEELD
jgi:hypothetical protein